MKIKNVKIGTDPEMFLFSKEENKFVPVCGLVGGTKKEPLAISVFLLVIVQRCSLKRSILLKIILMKQY